MPDKDKIQQSLYDFDATIKAKPNLSDKELLSKFPEFGNDATKLQAAKDYSATLNSGKYKDVSEFNSKFPEFFAEEVKKKELLSSKSLDTKYPSSLQETAKLATGEIFGDISKGIAAQEQLKPKPKAKKAEAPHYGQFIDIGQPIAQEVDKSKAVIPESGPMPWEMKQITKGQIKGKIANILSAGKRPTVDELGEIAALNKELQSMPRSEAEIAFEKDGFGIFKKNPLLGVQFLGETMLSSLSSLAESGKRTVPTAVGMGAAMGAPIAGIGAVAGAATGLTAGLLTGGYNISTSQDILNSLSDNGVDISDKDSLINAFSDEKRMAKIRSTAAKYGVPILAFDALTSGIAGKLIGGAVGKSLSKKIIAGMGEAGIQAVGGSGGELAGQLASGKKVNWDEVALEGIASLATDVPDITVGAMIERRNASSNNKTLATQIAVQGNEAGLEDAKINLDRDLKNGVISEEEHQDGVKFIEKAAEINTKIPETVQGENRAKSIELINERDKLTEEINQKEEQKKSVDVAYHKSIDESNKEVQKRIDEINNQLGKLAKPENNVEEEIQQPIDFSNKSDIELENRQTELENAKFGTKESKEFNDIDKELEKREWRRVFDAPLDKINEVVDELIKKDKEMPNGWGSYIDSKDARLTKEVADKYKYTTSLLDSEVIKDFKEAMFGNPSSYYSDGLKLRESLRVASERGIDIIDKLSQEFIDDGYSKEDAVNMVKRKLEPILQNANQEQRKQQLIEQSQGEEVVTEKETITPKTEEYAVPIESATSVLQPTQERIGETGGERIGVEQGKQGEEIAPKGISEAEAKINEEKAGVEPIIGLNKDNKQPFTTKSKKQIVSFENGDLIVRDAKTGVEVSAQTKKKALREYAENFDFTVGEKAAEPSSDMQFKDENELNQYVIENSQNPTEIAEVYINQEPTTQPLSTVERMIADYGVGKVTNKSFERFGDRNLKGISMAKAYFNNQTGQSIDQVAKEMSDHYDVEITPQNIADFMIRFPNGEGAALRLVESDVSVSAANKFKELTGLNLNQEIAQKVIEQQFNKLSKAEQLIAQQDYESATQLEEAYWREYEKTNGFTEESPRGEIEPKEAGKRKEEPKIEAKEGAKEPPTTPPTPPKETKGGSKPLRMEDKSILNRINNSENISQNVKDKLKDKLRYKVSSQEEARSIAKEILKEYEIMDAVALAESGKFDGDVNSFLFAEALDMSYKLEQSSEKAEDKIKYAEQWKDIAIKYDETARDKGRFISAIQDFYKKSPLGIKMVEESKRKEEFTNWYENKEKSYKEVFESLIKEPEFEELISKKVEEKLKLERAEYRKNRRTKIEKFFDDAKFKGNALYAVPIPPKVINGALEAMKQSFLAGESVFNAVEVAVEYISTEISNWDKEKFRKEYTDKLTSIDAGKEKKTEAQLTEEKKQKLLDKFRNKLKGLDESQKEEVIRKSFKKLVENGALEYEDFKQIIAETIGLGELTAEQANRITELVNDINAVEDIAFNIRQEGNRSIDNIKKYQEAKRKAEKSATELGALVYNKPNITRRLLSIMQLNTLGIPSLVNNPLFNIFNQLTVRFPIGLQLSLLDQIIYRASKVSNKIFGTDIIMPENNIFISQKEFFKKLGQGAYQSSEQIINGLTNKDYFQKEVYASQIQPFTSAKDLWDWKFNKKRLTKSQLADKTMQATVGIPAEIVARLLNVGDKPQRYAAEGIQAGAFAKMMGLKNIDYEYFLEFPQEEAYRYFKSKGLSDELAMKKAQEIKERIIKQGEESVFQQDNFLNDAINASFEQSKKYGDFAYNALSAIKMLNFPFLKIPLNAFWSVYNLVNPEIALAQSAAYAIRAIKTKNPSDIQQSKKWAAHATTGMALLSLTAYLAKEGIINADNDDETTKKERMGEKTYEQQKSINVTKLNALLSGQNPNDVKNGLNVDLKWFGNVGNILNIQALKLEDLTPEQKENGVSLMEDLMANLKISSLELIDNGVFSNASAAITALNKGGSYGDSYLMNLINMGGNIVQPAMFAQMSRAQLPYYSKIKADSFYEELKNNILSRSSAIRALADKYPPSQIGIWGDTLQRKDDFILKLFGMSTVNKDNFAQPIYEDYKRTNNTKFLPPSVKPQVNGFKLNTEQARNLEILVGQIRKNQIAPFVNGGAKIFGKRYTDKALSDNDKILFLNIIYELAYQKAEQDFLMAYPQFKKNEEKESIREKREINLEYLRDDIKDKLKLE